MRKWKNAGTFKVETTEEPEYAYCPECGKDILVLIHMVPEEVGTVKYDFLHREIKAVGDTIKKDIQKRITAGTHLFL